MEVFNLGGLEGSIEFKNGLKAVIEFKKGLKDPAILQTLDYEL